MPDRLETLKSLLEQNPSDTFARYGLAMEYARRGEYEQASSEYLTLISLHPDYAPAYFHGGQAFERLGKLEEARDLYRRGLEVTARQGNAHAHSEMQAALDLIG